MRADAFTTIRSVGGLLPSDALARVAEGRGLSGLEPRDYHLVGGETVRAAANTFRLVRMRDEKQHGEYRTKRLILDVYDRMAAAMAGKDPFHTLLDPPPGRGLTHRDRDPSDGGAQDS